MDGNVCSEVLYLILKQLGQDILNAARGLLIVNILTESKFLENCARDKVEGIPLQQSIEMAILRRMKGGVILIYTSFSCGGIEQLLRV